MNKIALACAAALAMLGAGGGSEANASITSVYIADSARGQGGTIAVEGLTVPAGTCGIRWRKPTAWAWSPDTLDVLPSSATYGVYEEMQFSGPYPGCGSDPYLFPFPLTVDGKAPFPWATELIVQVKSADDIEFLDKHHNALPPVAGPGPDPKPRPICEIKDFCESKEQDIDGGPTPTHSGAPSRAPRIGAE